MPLKAEEIRKLFRFNIMYHIIGIYLAGIMLLALAIYGGYRVYAHWDTFSILNGEVESYKSSLEFIGRTKNALSERVDGYNKTLEVLIPDQETHFSVVSALETLAKKTGVTIRTYTIDLESTSVSKLSLRVEISGSEEAMKQLLNTYHYAGGRLITIEKVELATVGEAVNIFLFNFYHQPYVVGSGSGQQEISEKDIELMDQISGQLEVTP